MLIIRRRADRREDYEIQDIVENCCRFQTPVTAIVHDMDYVNRRISEGQYFFAQICKNAILLFNAGSIDFADGPLPDWGRIKVTAQRDFDKF